MAANRKNFLDGIGLVPGSSDTNTTKGDLQSLNSDGKLYSHNGTTSSALVTEKHASQGAARLENKDLDDASTSIVDSADTTKKIKFDAAGTTGTTTTLTSSQTANRVLTLPDATDTLTGRDTADTLTNKTISGSSNTLTNIGNSSLTNSSVTVNGQTVSLGGSTTVTASTTNALTIGTGLSGTSFDGSSPVTIAIDSTVVTLTGSQSLSNKTLTSPIINTATADTITGIAAGDLTLNSPTGQNVVIQNNGTTIATATSTALSLGSAKLLSLLNNSQTVSLSASASASASYTITLPAAAPTASTALVYNGSTFVWGQAGGWTVGTSTSLGAGGTISISTTAGQQVFTVASSGGNVTLAGAAFGGTDPVDGATIRLIGTSDTNTVSLVDSDTANGLRLKGNCTLTSGDVIEFQYIASSDRFFEVARNF